MPFSLGPTEMIFIMVLLLLVFGAKRLPELGSGLGKGIREFKRSVTELKGEIDNVGQSEQIQPPRKAQAVSQPAEPAASTASRDDATPAKNG